MPMATASMYHAQSGMQIAGKYGIGVLSIASTSTEGLQALPTQWSFAEEARRAARHDGRPPRLARPDDLAHRRDQGAGRARGRPRAASLAQRVQRAGRSAGRAQCTSKIRGICSTRSTESGAEGAGAAVIGTPDDLVAAISDMQEITGGFGVVLGFAHDWANREATRRSLGPGRPLRHPGAQRLRDAGCRRPRGYVDDNKAELIGGASAAVMSKIMAHEGAAAGNGDDDDSRWPNGPVTTSRRPRASPHIWAGIVPAGLLGGFRPTCRDGSRPDAGAEPRQAGVTRTSDAIGTKPQARNARSDAALPGATWAQHRSPGASVANPARITRRP